MQFPGNFNILSVFEQIGNNNNPQNRKPQTSNFNSIDDSIEKLYNEKIKIWDNSKSHINQFPILTPYNDHNGSKNNNNRNNYAYYNNVNSPNLQAPRLRKTKIPINNNNNNKFNKPPIIIKNLNSNNVKKQNNNTVIPFIDISNKNNKLEKLNLKKELNLETKLEESKLQESNLKIKLQELKLEKELNLQELKLKKELNLQELKMQELKLQESKLEKELKLQELNLEKKDNNYSDVYLKQGECIYFGDKNTTGTWRIRQIKLDKCEENNTSIVFECLMSNNQYMVCYDIQNPESASFESETESEYNNGEENEHKNNNEIKNNTSSTNNINSNILFSNIETESENNNNEEYKDDNNEIENVELKNNIDSDLLFSNISSVLNDNNF